MIPTIIGISGVTGAGKTTLVNSLAQELKASVLYWDDFDGTSTSPPDYVDWYYRGQDFSEWDYATLADVLKALKSKQSVIHPTTKQELQTTEFIIFDAPLGRLHQQTGKFIDICIHLEVPLDISLCRRLIRDFTPKDKTKDELINELQLYLSDSRPLFFDDKLKAKADFIVDGTLTTEYQIKSIKKYLQNKIKTTQNLSEMAFCVEYFYAKPGHKVMLQQALLKLVEKTKHEEGYIQYDLFQDKENSNLTILIVKFKNQKTMKQHEEQNYIKTFAEFEMKEHCERFVWNEGLGIKDFK